MRQSLLPILLLTTITLSLSDMLPLVSDDQTDAEASDNDQEYDNTFNSVNNNDRNIFYELFKETDNDKSIKSRRAKYKVPSIRNLEDIPRKDNNYYDKGFRKEQWHNYPRQLDRLHKNSHVYSDIENYDNKDEYKRNDLPVNDLHHLNNDDTLSNNDIDDVAGPLLILKIRLAFLTNNMNNIKENSNEYSDAITPNTEKLNKYYSGNENHKIFNVKDAAVTNKKERLEKTKKKDLIYSDINPEEKKFVNKRIFSLWSRLQSLSHKGHELQHRRHLYTYYGLPENGGGTLTAETRASFARPPGSPLRWG